MDDIPGIHYDRQCTIESISLSGQPVYHAVYESAPS
jgi:hypothetical protein